MNQDPRIEAAAKALYKQEASESGSPDPWPSWDGEGNAAREIFRTHATAAIAAVDKAATITTAEGLDALPAGSRIMLHCDLLLRIAEVVDDSNWIDLSNACPVDNENLGMVLANVGYASVVQWGPE